MTFIELYDLNNKPLYEGDVLSIKIDKEQLKTLKRSFVEKRVDEILNICKYFDVNEIKIHILEGSLPEKIKFNATFYKDGIKKITNNLYYQWPYFFKKCFKKNKKNDDFFSFDHDDLFFPILINYFNIEKTNTYDIENSIFNDINSFNKKLKGSLFSFDLDDHFKASISDVLKEHRIICEYSHLSFSLEKNKDIKMYLSNNNFEKIQFKSHSDLSESFNIGSLIGLPFYWFNFLYKNNKLVKIS